MHGRYRAVLRKGLQGWRENAYMGTRKLEILKTKSLRKAREKGQEKNKTHHK